MSPSAPPPVRVYLDHNASAPLRESARAAMLAALEICGNPSSIHGEGRAARARVERARGQVAAAVGVRPEHVVFTSGGTEAANLAISPSLVREGRGAERLLASAGEHPCVLLGHRFGADRVELAPLRGDGMLDLEAFAAALRRPGGGVALVALQAANNETGVVQPLAEAAALAHAEGAILVCDAVQALGRMSFESLSAADVLILSAHKIGGPKGVGALVFDPARLHMSGGLVRGGGQERGLRGGTENVAGIAGFGAASEEASRSLPREASRLKALRETLEAGLRAGAPDLLVFGAAADRLPNTSAFAAPGLKAEMLVAALDLAGAAISSGSACSSGKVAPSHVLSAMGVEPELAACALRASMGWSTSENDVSLFCETFEKTVRSVRSRRVGRAA